MRCYQVGDSLSLQSLTLVERPDPVPGPGEVLIDVRAAALNWRDIEIVTGQFFSVKPETRIPLSDGAGVILAVGSQVTKFVPGDRVICNHFSDWLGGPWDPDEYYPGDLGDNRDGFMSDRAVVPAHCCVKLPDTIPSFEEACTLPTAGNTAWRMLHDLIHIKSSDTILTLGTGGVSVFTLQVAKMAGARVIITSSSDDKLAMMKQLGADLTINYRTRPDWHKEVLRITEGKGVQYVFDHAGPATMRQSIVSCAANGKVFMVGRTGGVVDTHPSILGAYKKNVSLLTLSNGPRYLLDELVRAWGYHGTKPLIDRVFPFDQGVAAFEYLASGAHTGKVVLRID